MRCRVVTGGNPWPGLIWHTYDYYLNPAGTYFGMKKSMEPLHIMYSYPQSQIYITNCLQQQFTRLKAEAAIYNLDGTLKFSKQIITGVEPDSVQLCFALPPLEGLSPTYLLRLQLAEAGGAVKSINWYWLAQKGDVLDWKKSKWYTTPESAYADYCKGGDDILPVIFSDNYLELAPGETATIHCTYAIHDAQGAAPHFLVSAWNLDAVASKATGNVGFEEPK